MFSFGRHSRDESLLQYTSTDQNQEKTSICQRIKWELSQPLFTLEEPNGCSIDVRRTFAPGPICQWTLPVRSLFFFGSTMTITYNVLTYKESELYMYMGFMTNWSVTMSLMYQFTSWLCALIPGWLTRQPPKGQEPGMVVKTMWFLFGISSNVDLLVVLVYWFFLEEAQFTPINIYKHGGMCLMVLIDGYLIGNIPLRVKHLGYTLTFGVLYILWTIIHDILGLGNGKFESDDVVDDDSALYPVLSWTNRPLQATTTSLLVVFVLCPVFFLILWCLSLCQC